MTIASEIQRIKTNIANAYTACDNKGATMPTTQNSANLANCINSIQGGGGGNIESSKTFTVDANTSTISTISPSTGYDGMAEVTADLSYIETHLSSINGSGTVPIIVPTGTYPITANGTYDITNYANVEVEVESQSEQGFLIQSDGSSNTGFVFKSVNVETISAYQCMFNKFYTFGNTISSVDFSGVASISGDQALAYAFQLCTSITTVSFPDLISLTGGGALYYAFNGCTGLKNIYFNSLKSNSFGSYTNQFNSMLTSVSGCKVHFPSNLQSVIGSWSDVTAGFGGTNTSVLYDLPATT